MTKLRLSYQTIEFGQTDIHLCTLRDRQEFHDPGDVAKDLGINSAVWPLFGVVWPSSLVLAHYMDKYDIQSKRILEVGCGMALTSLLLNKRSADITATDYHPEVEAFLERNALLNDDDFIDFERVDWKDKKDSLGLFDLIVGSDLLYEDDHIELLSRFLENHAKPACEVIIVDPRRGRKNKLSACMEQFGFIASQLRPEHTEAYLEDDFKGHILKYVRAG